MFQGRVRILREVPETCVVGPSSREITNLVMFRETPGRSRWIGPVQGVRAVSFPLR
jgi:hypothetical protein